jgi:hypothetical protein
MPDERPPLDEIADFFEGLTDQGDTHQGVGWPTLENQRIRFEAALRLIEPEAGEFTVNDLGCGLAHMYEFIHGKGLPMSHYRGVDVSEKSLELARERLGDKVELVHSDRLTEDADYSFACGIFNTRLKATDEEWTAFMKSVVADLYEHSARGCAFSSLSTYVDWTEPQLFYADPMEMFRYCKENVSPRVALWHDYPIYEWTILIRRPDEP